MSKTIKEKIKKALRITLGVCFILSGVMKAVNVYSFAQEIRLYIEAYMDSKISSKIIRNFNYLKEQSCCFVTKSLHNVTLQKNKIEFIWNVFVFC